MAALTSSFAGCATNTKACTLVACGNQGVRVDFVHREAGTYEVDVVVDGTASRCTATLPLSDTEGARNACTSPDIILTRTGSALPASEQSIGGLYIRDDAAKSITVRVRRDGEQLHDATFAPAYVVSPGPNGPDCEPKECKGATFTLP